LGYNGVEVGFSKKGEEIWLTFALIHFQWNEYGN